MGEMKPILFNTENVRAILEGRKTATRRFIRFLEGTTGRLPINGDTDYIFWPCGIKRSPYKLGDILYVRETWGEDNHNWLYKADFSDSDLDKLKHLLRWRPSIHMPKKVARLFLRVTDVRAERLQDITIADCKAEGAIPPPAGGDEFDYETDPDLNYWFAFQNIWDSTIKPADIDRYGWNANPWVWVIEFERISREEAVYS